MKNLKNAFAACLALLIGWGVAGSAAAGTVVIQNFSDINPKDAKNMGAYQDTNGSKIALDVKGKGTGMYLEMTYTLVQGGYCGLWCRAGGKDWSGVNIASAKAISLSIYCKSPMVLSISLKDKNNNQYVAKTPSTKGGSWETVSIPLDSFQLDPYYTPPGAVKGAPKDFSAVTTFGIQPQPAGTFNVGVRNIVAQ